MSVKGSIKEAGEKLKDQKMAREGRNLRNKGRLENGELPKTTEPGTTGH